jgi:DNA invertase Pin-like site-specific DNA recombinase
MIAIYARQSIDKKDSISIDTQIEYAKREAFNEEIKVYQDKGYSGKNIQRPAFEKMMEDVASGLIEKIVVYRLDRISRSILDFADFINELEGKNVSFVSATEKFDTSAPMGRAMLYIIIVFAQLERETIAERVKDNYYSRVKKGALGGGPAPYGFDIVKKTIDGMKMSVYKENENIKNVIKIFEAYSKPGKSLADVQRQLITDGIKTASGKAWDNVKLSSLLKSPAYVKADIHIHNYYKSQGAIIVNDIESFNGINGCILVGKRDANKRKYNDVSNHVLAITAHEGVIDSGTFLYCQEKLKKNKQIKNLHKGKHSWLTGFVKCGACGYAFSVRKGKCSEGYVSYFYCSGRYLHKVCNEIQTHRVDDVEAFVEDELIKRIKSNAIISDSASTEPDTKTKQIEEIDAKINNLILSLEEASPISLRYINQRIETLDSEKRVLFEAHSKIISSKKDSSVFNINVDAPLSFEEKRELAKSLIDKVILDSKTIQIAWK